MSVLVKKILVLDGVSQSPLALPFSEALQKLDVQVKYIDGKRLPKKRLYRLRRAFVKWWKKYKNPIYKHYHFPKAKSGYFRKLINDFQPDIVLVVGFSHAIISREDLMKLKTRHGFSLVLWDTDSANYFYETKAFMYFLEEEFRRYDFVLSFSKRMSDYLNSLELGLPRCEFFPFGAPDQGYSHKAEKTIDVCFAGADNFRRLFILSSIKVKNFLIIGARWKKVFSIMPKDIQAKCTKSDRFGDSLHKQLQQSKIVLNVTNENFYGIETGINLRVFEALSLGCFLLTDSYQEIEELFNPGESIETFSSREELSRKIDYYLAHDEEREAIAKKGHEVFLAHYTWKKRAAAFLEFF